MSLNPLKLWAFSDVYNRPLKIIYEIYFINLWKPPLNKDDKARDTLTVSLPEVEWMPFETHLWDKWLQEIDEKDRKEERRRQARIDNFNYMQAMRRKWRAGEINEEEYFACQSKQEGEDGFF